MNKTISTTVGILIIILVAGVAGASVLFFNQGTEEEFFIEGNEITAEEDTELEEDKEIEENVSKKDKTEEEYDSETEKEKIENIVKYFMKEAYVNKNYEKVSALYIPPKGFEWALGTGDRGEWSLQEYIEWYVRSVSIDQDGARNIVHIEVIDIKESEYEEGVFFVSFSFIEEGGDPVLYGPCCGADEPPGSVFFTRVMKTEGVYKIYEELPYIP